jgi:hypothetical protein
MLHADNELRLHPSSTTLPPQLGTSGLLDRQHRHAFGEEVERFFGRITETSLGLSRGDSVAHVVPMQRERRESTDTDC